MIYFLGILSVFIAVFGMEGRGSWSHNISVIGGILWLASVVLAFLKFSIGDGFLFLIGTFILGAILQRILRPLLNRHGH